MKKLHLFLLYGVIVAAVSVSCRQTSSYKKNVSPDVSGSVRLNITGMVPSFKAMENAINAFCTLYPDVTIDYEYIQNYSQSIRTRLEHNDSVDIFITTNIQEDSPLLPYTLELKSQKNGPDFSTMYDGFVRNFTITANGRNELYAVPLGGELRGMYVNTTVLSQFGLAVPKNYRELINCCSVLKGAGYIPLQLNPGTFGQMLMYPYVCSLIANSPDYENVYKRVNSCEPGISALFREPFARLYELTAAGYYNYKYIEGTYGGFTDTDEETVIRSFLNLDHVPEKGQPVFMPCTISLKSMLDKAKTDYHRAVEYQFILSPVGDDGGYAYLSPAAGIAVNKNSLHKAYALEFVRFLLSEKENRRFAADQNIIPNTAGALDVVSSLFHIDRTRICQLGQVSFDYVFYSIIRKNLIDVSKCNNPKYMAADGTMYSLDHYMQNLEADFAEQRGKLHI